MKDDAGIGDCAWIHGGLLELCQARRVIEGCICMKLDHLNLTVTDPIESQQFLMKYFGLRPMGKSSRHIAFLTDDDGLLLSLTNIKLSNGTEVHYPPTFHIGFSRENQAGVNEINQRLKDDGYNVPPPSKQHGAWTFYFEAPGGFTIEVQSGLDSAD
jgi:catechol-2,3-dioxygenase